MLSLLNNKSLKELELDLCQGSLSWIVTKPNTELIFLDVTVSLDPSTGKITTKTYKKTQNLHSYLPENSAHAPGVLK